MNDTDDIFTQHACRLVINFLAISDGITQLDLVKATHFTAPTVSNMLRDLEDEGYVRRVRDEKDMRAIRVYLTEKGRALDQKNINKIKEVDAIALQGLTSDERDTLMNLLCKIRNNLLDTTDEKNKDTEDKK